MFTQKLCKGPTSCSSPSLSSLSDIALRNRTVSRDRLSILSENESIRDVLPYVTSSNSSITVITKRKKNRGRAVPLRKTKKGKGSILRNPKLELKDTMVIAPFHALKDSFQKQLKLCCKKINVSSEEDLDKEIRSILKSNVKSKKRNEKKYIRSEESRFCGCLALSSDSQLNGLGKRMTNSGRSSVILEEVKLNNGRSKNKSKLNPFVPKKKSRPQRKKKVTNRGQNPEAEPFLHKKNARNNSNMKRKLQKDWIRTYNTRYRARLIGKENTNKNDLIDISLDTDLDNNPKEPESKNPNLDGIVDDTNDIPEILNTDDSNSEEPPCIILHPYDPSKRRNEKITSDDSEDDSDNAMLKENSADKKLVEEKTSDGVQSPTSPKTNKNVTTEEFDKIEMMEDEKVFNVVEPCVIIREHHNEPSSAEFSTDDEHEEEITNFFNNQVEEKTRLSCGLQEGNLPNYVFGQRNDFSRLRESCEFSFGLSRTENDEQNDFGNFQ